MENEKTKCIEKACNEMRNVLESVEHNYYGDVIYGPSEDSHIEADQILCNLLKELGAEEVVELFQKLKKWYA